jgi:hypothetical protein
MEMEKFYKILENHRHWLYKDCQGWQNMRADLSNVDLSFANLRDIDLRNANLSNANLCCADLSFANLENADLNNAKLCRTNLSFANLENADLNNANLYGANLYGAKLCNTNLSFAKLDRSKHFPYIPMVCPEEGAFIGWKKAEYYYKEVIVKLRIPASAKRSSSTTRKCRCSKAKVLEIYDLDGTIAEERSCYSSYDLNFNYKVGKTVTVADFDENRWNECSTGIHFFMNRQEAKNYC